MAKIEDSLCEAIEYIVNSAVAAASYDKTIQATISSCEDESLGKYLVKYQDSIFYAYSNDIEKTYSKGTSVYILIPGNDMNSTKTIIGTIDKLGTEYAEVIETQEAYNEIGINAIENNSAVFELCSYKEKNLPKVIYDYNNAVNIIGLNTITLDRYLKENSSTSIKIGATIKTSLPYAQQSRGDYGIIVEMLFNDNTGTGTVVRNYVLNTNQIIGNPYKNTVYTKQFGIYDIDGANFIRINKISLYNDKFPYLNEEETANDIFIKDLVIIAMESVNQDSLISNNLSFITPNGVYLDNNVDEVILKAQIKINGKVKNEDYIKYYWFRENAKINNTSERYNKRGGAGWECLNEYNISVNENGNDPVTDWVPADNNLTIDKMICVSKAMSFKCVAVYNDIQIERIIKVYNELSEYEIEIVSSNGTQFYYDNNTGKNPNLTCNVTQNGNKLYDITYYWSYTDNLGNTENIVSNEETLSNINISSIINYRIYRCSVYKNNIFIGSASLTLTNTLKIEGLYSLVVNNGTQVFKYNESGVSPASESSEIPITIYPLTISLYNNLGQEVDRNILVKKAKVTWVAPTENTLLEPKSMAQYNNINEPGVYRQVEEFIYTIASRYSAKKKNNNITVMVEYEGMQFTSTTNFTFLKDGEDGTNGTEYVCKIVPNVYNNQIPEFIYYNEGMNYDFASISNAIFSSNYFKLLMYKNGELFYDSINKIQDGVKITWSFLQNKYKSTVLDKTLFNAGTWTRTGENYNFNTAVSNIIKCRIEYENNYYYATLPILLRNYDNKWNIYLKEYTGFKSVLYAADGTNPTYDTTNPFTFYILDNNGVDITTEASFEYSKLGSIYSNKVWTNTTDLRIKEFNNNTVTVVPSSNYDGLCVTNALVVKATCRGTSKYLHIPIYMSLNRFGNAAINKWDGNSININNDDGVILAPQVGAGIKNDDNNTFTGMIMGKVKSPDKSSAEVGLVGYYQGQRSLFLDAETGKATFGLSTKSQIIIDPDSGAATIASGNFKDRKGLKIDFSESPSIKFGSGKFSVDSEGFLESTSGKIAGWNISSEALWTSKVGMSPSAIAFWAGASSYDNRNTAKFRVTKNGTLYASDASISGEIEATEGSIGGWTINDTSLESKDNGIAKTEILSNGKIRFGIDCTKEYSKAPTFLEVYGKRKFL